MTDQESEINQAGPDAPWEGTDPFSTNGSDPGGTAVATEGPEAELDDRSTFLADLARVMQTTAAAEQARNAEGTEQRRQAHIDAIRAREALEAEELRELAKEDVKGIDAWSEGEIKRIKLERERRIASRREQLQIRLEEHRSVIASEVDAVEAAIATYRADVGQFFGSLEAETDPIAIARQAGNQPKFPDLTQIGPDDAPVGTDYGYVVSAGPVSEPASADDGPRDDGEAGTDSPMIGVMDPEAGSRSVETPWDSGVDAGPVAGAGDGSADGAGGSAEGSEGSESAEGPEGSEAPEPVTAEARVVMPRNSGAGSWLRWPSSSVDRSDPSR
jgi:hypothetical protein